MLLVSQWPRLPEANEWWAFATIGIALIHLLRRTTFSGRHFSSHTAQHNLIWILWLALGVNMGSWMGCLSGQRLLKGVWPPSLTHTQVSVVGHVVGLPNYRTHPLSLSIINTDTEESAKPSPLKSAHALPNSTHIMLRPSMIKGSDPNSLFHLPKDLPNKIKLSTKGVLKIQPGDKICVDAQLISPRGWHNPVGRNQRLVQLRNQIQAVGKVKHWIPAAECEHLWQQIPALSPLEKIVVNLQVFSHRIRLQIRRLLLRQLNQHPMKPFMLALAIGDSKELTHTQWQQLKRSGIAHLMAISGLHIGLIATFGFFIGKGIAVCLNVGLLGISNALAVKNATFSVIGYGLTRLLPACFALSFAAIYSALAGMSLPTQRALIMVTGVLTAWLLGRRWPKRYIWFGSLVIVLWIDPLAPYFAGFWLSFMAVAGLLYYWQGLHIPPLFDDERPQNSIQRRFLLPLFSLLQSQWVLFFVLFIPAWLWQTHASIFSFLYNLVAIPWVSFIVIPLLMLSGLLFFIQQHFLTPLTVSVHSFFEMINPLHWSAECLQYLMNLIEWGMAIFPTYQFSLPQNNIYFLLFVVTIVLLMIWPSSHLRIKAASILLGVAGLFFSQSSPNHPQIAHKNSLSITLFDVGQALAIWVQTPNHQLLYDTGREWQGFAKAAQTVIYPYITQQVPPIKSITPHKNTVPSVDVLMISHSDQDHAGGVQTLLDRVHFQTLLSSSPIEGYPSKECQAGTQWQWDDVTFKILWPSASMLGTPYSPLLQRKKTSLFTKTNNQSCVLLIQIGEHAILLSGDIEQAAEWQLLQDNAHVLQKAAPLSLLVAPHHCSQTSSSLRWVSQLKPKVVICSVGYRNFYGHPSPKVVERYTTLANSDVLHTAQEGAIRLTWHSPLTPQPHIIRERRDRRRYWLTPYENTSDQ